MSVNKVYQSAGSWVINLKSTIPRYILDRLDYFGHIAVVPGRVDPVSIGDNLLTAARYVGVLRGRDLGDSYSIFGAGLEIWLGDEDDKGDVFENAVVFASASFANTIRGLLPPGGSVTEGTLHAIAGLYNGQHQWQTPRDAIQYVCDTYGATWRVNNNATLDAGLASDLFVSTPTCVIMRRGVGVDMSLRALPGSIEVERDVDDFTTRVILLAEGDGASIYTGSADISPALNPYKDLHGNTLVRKRMVSESDTETSNATARAQLQLNRFTGTRDAMRLSAADYDIIGSFDVGDTVWVYDPDSGLVDTANEISFRGQRINPIKLQAVETSWPVVDGYTVAYRSGTGVWTDLTDHVEFDSAQNVSVTVGDLSRSLTTSGFEPIGSRPNSDKSVPGVPSFITPFTGGAYLDNRGFTKAQVLVTWAAPNNVDGSTIIDGDHYEVRYAVDSNVVYPATWQHVSVIRWEDMQTWQQPFASPSSTWNIAYVPWSSTSVRIQDLAPGVGYDFQIRAVDTTGNASDWSATTVAITTQDNIPPQQPKPPEVASSRIAIQVTHRLGMTGGADYSLDDDLDHLDVHVGYSDTFYPDDSTRVGKLKANAGMIAAGLPAVGTFPVEQTYQVHVKVVAVDITGNKSIPSGDAVATASLIDDAHISDLTVSKLTAGTIGADFIVGARIKTADTGARVELNSAGLQAYDVSGSQTVNISDADGSVSIIGQLSSGPSGNRVVVSPSGATSPEIRFYPGTGTNYTRMRSIDSLFPFEATFFITSGTNYTNSAYSEYEHSAGFVAARVFSPADGSQNGGGVEIAESYATLEYILGSTDNHFKSTAGWSEMVSITATSLARLRLVTGVMEYYGKHYSYTDLGADQGWFTGSFAVSAGSQSVSLSYGSTKSHSMVAIANGANSGHGVMRQCVTAGATSTTGFTVDVDISTSFGWTIVFWCYGV